MNADAEAAGEPTKVQYNFPPENSDVSESDCE